MHFYQLFPNELSQALDAKSNKYLLSHNFCDSEIQK